VADTATTIVARGLRLARRDPDRATDASEGLEYLNEAHKAVLTDGTPWTFLEATGQASLTAGTQRYTLSSLATQLSLDGVERVVAVTNDTDGTQPLKGMHWKQLERLAGNSQDDSEGYPVAYAQVGLGTSSASIMFWPTPQQAFTLGFLVRLKVVDLAGGDTPLIPDEHASAVLSPYVAARMWEQQSGAEAANEAAKQDLRHQAALRRLTETYGSARDEDVLFIEPTLYDYLDAGWWPG
jgi:hypothetical protein